MIRWHWLAASGIVFYMAAVSLEARRSYSVDVRFRVLQMQDLSFSSGPAPFILIPGARPKVDTLTTYSLVTNSIGQKIMASLDSDMPPGVRLAVSLTAPKGATSNAWQTLSSIPVELVRGIKPVDTSGLSIAYLMAADTTAQSGGSEKRTILYTLSD